MTLQSAALAGIEVSCIPFIDVKSIDDDGLANQIAALEKEELYVVLTSKMALISIIPYLSCKPKWKIYCTEGITQKNAVAFFGKDAIVETGANSKELRDKILKNKEIESVVFFCGDKRLTNIPEYLPQHGISVQEVIVYKTIETSQYIQKDYEGVLFFSPSAVHSFFSENTLLTNTQLFAIGKTTAQAIRTYCRNKVTTATYAGQEALMQLVIDHKWN